MDTKNRKFMETTQGMDISKLRAARDLCAVLQNRIQEDCSPYS